MKKWSTFWGNDCTSGLFIGALRVSTFLQECNPSISAKSTHAKSITCSFMAIWLSELGTCRSHTWPERGKASVTKPLSFSHPTKWPCLGETRHAFGTAIVPLQKSTTRSPKPEILAKKSIIHPKQFRFVVKIKPIPLPATSSQYTIPNCGNGGKLFNSLVHGWWHEGMHGLIVWLIGFGLGWLV